MVRSKWHFGQFGHGGKKTIWEFFLPNFSVKKVEISCSVTEMNIFFKKLTKLHIWVDAFIVMFYCYKCTRIF